MTRTLYLLRRRTLHGSGQTSRDQRITSQTAQHTPASGAAQARRGRGALMSLPPFIRNRPRTVSAITAAVVLVGAGVATYFLWPRPKPESKLPPPDSPLYQDYAEEFQMGTAHLEY